MVRSLGIDPGTGSFDLVLIEGDRVLWEKSIPTIEVARNPSVLLDSIREAGQVDIIVGPSGYGSPIICNDEIVDPGKYALHVLLLSRREDIEEGVKRGEIGIMVYKAIVDVVVDFWREKLPVCYIPSVILLPTIPLYRKINKIDMGTADKLAVTALAVYDQARRLGISYGEVDFILVEMGFGYNAVIRVVNGVVVDGLGGTLTPNGFLTVGSLDGEAVVMGRYWSRSDVFYGGVSSICKTTSIEEALEKRREDELCSEAFKSMYYGIVRNIHALIGTTGKPCEIILSGRLTRYDEIYSEIKEYLEEIAPVAKLQGLRNARISKEAGQGYALIGEGLLNGFFKDLIEHMKIREARGTVLDYMFHPRLSKVKEELRDILKESVKPSIWSRIL
ncbi:MAG: butyrate kinase [Desulfurococcales archaeon ex4484_58]|nr:MAG: butyrate kinase [Desulfurococcales archaeon ex4484_58]